MGNKQEKPRGPHRVGELAALQSWRIEWVGGRELWADGCKGVIRFDPESVSFRIAGGVFCVYGTELTIDAMNGGELTVRGRILRTEWMP